MDKNLIQKAFGINFKKYRQFRNKSQEEVALIGNMSPTYIGAIERGEKCPTIDTVFKICNVLHISPAQLLDFEVEQIEETEYLVIVKNAFKSVPDKHKLKLAKVFERLALIYDEDL